MDSLRVKYRADYFFEVFVGYLYIIIASVLYGVMPIFITIMQSSSGGNTRESM